MTFAGGEMQAFEKAGTHEENFAREGSRVNVLRCRYEEKGVILHGHSKETRVEWHV